MTPLNKFLFFKAESTARQVGYKYAWFSKNKIFVKKNESSKIIIVEDENSISNIVKKKKNYIKKFFDLYYD